MAKKVEIVALVSVLGQPSYDKSRWANFFGEKLAKVTKGKDKIAAINAMMPHLRIQIDSHPHLRKAS